MITLSAKIDLMGRETSILGLSSFNGQGNNISSTFGEVVGKKKKAQNPFILGASKLGVGCTFSENVDYFIGNQLSNDNGEFETEYVAEIVSQTPITSISISFDTVNNRHPKNIYVDGVEYIDDDPIFTVVGLTANTNHTIKIRNWSEPQHPLVVTGVYAEGISIELNSRNLISISSSMVDRENFQNPSYGIISRTGDIEFLDSDGQVYDYAQLGLLKDGANCEIRLNNTLFDGFSQVIDIMETDKWEYDADNKTFTVSLKDDLEEWQQINIPAYEYDPRKQEAKPYSWLYEGLWGITTSKGYNMQSLSDLDEATKRILQRLYFEYPLLYAGTLWDAWTKLCNVACLHIYKNSNGIIVCKYNGGN